MNTPPRCKVCGLLLARGHTGKYGFEFDDEPVEKICTGGWVLAHQHAAAVSEWLTPGKTYCLDGQHHPSDRYYMAQWAIASPVNTGNYVLTVQRVRYDVVEFFCLFWPTVKERLDPQTVLTLLALREYEALVQIVLEACSNDDSK